MIYKKCLKWIKEIKREIFKNELKLYLIINNDSFGVFFFLFYCQKQLTFEQHFFIEFIINEMKFKNPYKN